jgi:hypothetical protein
MALSGPGAECDADFFYLFDLDFIYGLDAATSATPRLESYLLQPQVRIGELSLLRRGCHLFQTPLQWPRRQ